MNKKRCKPHKNYSKELEEETLNKYYNDKIPFNVLGIIKLLEELLWIGLIRPIVD